jgi:hypothetical protein
MIGIVNYIMQFLFSCKLLQTEKLFQFTRCLDLLISRLLKQPIIENELLRSLLLSIMFIEDENNAFRILINFF